MFRRLIVLLLAATLLLVAGGCRKNPNVHNPIADLDSKQPDKELFDRAMAALERNRFDVARLTLQTLINTYPDSEYVARAKLAVGDSWYAEGSSTALAQAEAEYKDFQTFFPNMPEAAEAQMKVAHIHYRQMLKPDRDYKHAKQAEDEYRQMLLMYPDHELVEQAKQRLLQVQEVLAEREFRVGRFYFLRESWPAAIARLKSLVDTYPLFSGADEALYMLGGSYEAQMARINSATNLPAATRERMATDMAEKAAEAYSRIITRYPAMERAGEAAKRLQALGRPVPEPTPEALAQSQAEEASRGELGRLGKVWLNFKRGPDVAATTKVGEPTMVDPPQTNAPAIVKSIGDQLNQPSGTVTAETIGTGEPPQSDPVPRSQTEATEEEPQAPPTQVNEAAGGNGGENGASVEQSSADQKDSEAESTSKKKKKKGLRKLIPF